MNFTSIREVATRGDFPKLMDVGMKTSFFEAYKSVESEYEQVVSFETSTKDKETYPSLSDVSFPEKVLEGEEYPEKGIGEMQDVDITNYKFGEIIGITREMVDDDQTKKIKMQPEKLGKAHRYFENKLVFSTIVAGTTAATCYDGLAIFTTNHLNRKGGAAVAGNDNVYTSVTMSAGALIVALDMINLWTGLDGGHIGVNPMKIICTPRLAYTARWLMSPTSGIPAYAANALGPASNQAQTAGNNPLPLLGVLASKWLGKVGATALDWYIQTDVPGWIFQVRDPLELYAQGNLSEDWFNRDVMKWKSRKRFGFKNIDWRAMMLIS